MCKNFFVNTFTSRSNAPIANEPQAITIVKNPIPSNPNNNVMPCIIANS